MSESETNWFGLDKSHTKCGKNRVLEIHLDRLAKALAMAWSVSHSSLQLTLIGRAENNAKPTKNQSLQHRMSSH